MASETTTFETLRAALRTAPTADSPRERQISWVGSERRLGYARDDKGQLEVFLVGEPLDALERAVRERLVHDTWQTGQGETLYANRLCLPNQDQFDAIATTILLELLDKGFEDEPHEAFRRTEPLIALALEPPRAQKEVLTGLAGELLTLAMMIRLDSSSAERFIDAWQGWGRSSRDFQLGSTGLEVKASVTGASRHHIQGWYQIECGPSADGGIETSLYLLSIGIRWLPEDSPGATIESLVKEIVGALPVPRRDHFIDAVRGYCGARLLLDADGNAGQTSLRLPFISTYERLYDLQDKLIELPKSADFAAFGNVVSDTVTFEIELKERVRGDRNPVVGLASALSKFLAQPS